MSCARGSGSGRDTTATRSSQDELSNHGDRLLRLVAEHAVSRALEDANLGLRDRRRDVLRVRDRRDRIELAAEHQRRAADARQLGEQIDREALVPEEVVADLELETSARDHLWIHGLGVVDRK